MLNSFELDRDLYNKNLENIRANLYGKIQNYLNPNNYSEEAKYFKEQLSTNAIKRNSIESILLDKKK